MSGKSSIFENALVLILIGVLAGAVGGLAVGIVTGRTPTHSTSSPTT